ncbi:MAG: lytic murein transglycosylase [Candidatus Pacebacteria bacterium]|nr:lytic murein transglycosylase [Candidatus Paceibacterota bacterium]
MIKKKILVVFLSLSIFIPIFQGLTLNEQSDFCSGVSNINCKDINESSAQKIFEECGELVAANIQKKCQAQLQDLQRDKANIENKLNNLSQKENNTQWYISKIETDISYLNTNISNLNLSISQLNSAISQREKAISDLEQKIKKQKEILKEIILVIYKYDSFSTIEMFLKQSNLSEISQKVIEMNSIQKNLQRSMADIKEARDNLQKEKDALVQKKAEQEKLKAEKAMQIQSLAVKQEQQSYYLKEIQNAKTPLEREMVRVRAELQSLQAAMNQISAYLSRWVLSGDLSWASIFGAVANASAGTGARPALLLGILQHETRFATNLGRTQIWNTQSGQYRDFIEITSELCSAYGDPYCHPENLPLSGSGAMGPAQFMPSTWQGYRSKLMAAFPGQVPNPWNLFHAIYAMGMYVVRYPDDHSAACAYLLGGSNANCNHWYASAVASAAKEWDEILSRCGYDLSDTCLKKIENDLRNKANIPIE